MSLQLLPYLWEARYRGSFMEKGGYTYQMLEDELNHIPTDKKEDAVKFCIKYKVKLEIISTIFATIKQLNSLGNDYADNRYDRYYKKVIGTKQKLEDMIKKLSLFCTNPRELEPTLQAISNIESLIPIKKPSTMIYEAIRTNKDISENQDIFLKLFDDRVQSSENIRLTSAMNFKTKLFNNSNLGFGTLPIYSPKIKK